MQRNFQFRFLFSQRTHANLIDLVKSFPTSKGDARVVLVARWRVARYSSVQEDFSEYVRYMLRSHVQIFIFQCLSMSFIANSNKYLVATSGSGTAENESSKV